MRPPHRWRSGRSPSRLHRNPLHCSAPSGRCRQAPASDLRVNIDLGGSGVDLRVYVELDGADLEEVDELGAGGVLGKSIGFRVGLETERLGRRRLRCS
ncbi:hypothetical protein BRADI_5g01034v3 [Brachypodium distachyon]|uniref:Uncharacterized protein n=1 Tax=Brachypodium distachyon TaxID=15368 RepID=A0A0Q3E1A6_BRADI|nr:hypothetical protein BRADI_5g01034v3 [Brachypodium distachyon]